MSQKNGEIYCPEYMSDMKILSFISKLLKYNILIIKETTHYFIKKLWKSVVKVMWSWSVVCLRYYITRLGTAWDGNIKLLSKSLQELLDWCGALMLVCRPQPPDMTISIK